MLPDHDHQQVVLHLEAAVLGCLLLREGQGLEQVPLADADFSAAAHQEIYRAIAAIRADDGVADPVTVYHRIGRYATEISRAVNTVPTSTHLAWYASELARHVSERRIAAIREEAVRRHERGEDIEQVYRETQAAIQEVRDRYCPRVAAAPLAEALARLVHQVRSGERPPVLMTGLRYIDRLTLGLAPGDSVVLGGRPGTGKSDLALNIIVSLARAGVRSALISVEMTPEQLVERIASMVTMTDAVAMLRDPDSYSQQEREAFASEYGRIRQHLDAIDAHTDGVSTWPEIERRIRASVAAGSRLVVLDHLHQIITPNRDKRVEIGAISTAWKALLKELRVPGILLCHLSRAMESGRERTVRPPRLSDLRESGAIEGDADYVWLVHQPDSRQPTRVLIQAKGRQRPTGFVELVHSGPSHWLLEAETREGGV
jgi:replicative DNA helicase